MGLITLTRPVRPVRARATSNLKANNDTSDHPPTIVALGSNQHVNLSVPIVSNGADCVYDMCISPVSLGAYRVRYYVRIAALLGAYRVRFSVPTAYRLCS